MENTLNRVVYRVLTLVMKKDCFRTSSRVHLKAIQVVYPEEMMFLTNFLQNISKEPEKNINNITYKRKMYMA